MFRFVGEERPLACVCCLRVPPKGRKWPRCTVCIERNLPSTYYCGEECMNAHWPQHKQYHKEQQQKEQQQTTNQVEDDEEMEAFVAAANAEIEALDAKEQEEKLAKKKEEASKGDKKQPAATHLSPETSPDGAVDTTEPAMPLEQEVPQPATEEAEVAEVAEVEEQQQQKEPVLKIRVIPGGDPSTWPQEATFSSWKGGDLMPSRAVFFTIDANSCLAPLLYSFCNRSTQPPFMRGVSFNEVIFHFNEQELGGMETPADLKMQDGDVILVQPRIDRTIPDARLLRSAAVYGKTKVVKLVLKHSTENIDCRGDCGETALMKAADCGEARVVQLLLDHSASIDLRNNNGSFALAMAAEQGDAISVKAMLDAGADAALQGLSLGLFSGNGCDALKVAEYKGHVEVSKLLRKHLSAKQQENERERVAAADATSRQEQEAAAQEAAVKEAARRLKAQKLVEQLEAAIAAGDLVLLRTALEALEATDCVNLVPASLLKQARGRRDALKKAARKQSQQQEREREQEVTAARELDTEVREAVAAAEVLGAAREKRLMSAESAVAKGTAVAELKPQVAAEPRSAKPGKDKMWGDLTPAERAAAKQLGFDEASWDGEETPAASEMQWAELSDRMRKAARVLGYAQEEWDNGDEPAEVKAKAEAKRKARLEAEEKAQVETAVAKARVAADEKARKEAELKRARLEAEAKAKADAEQKARLQEEEQTRLEATGAKARVEAEEKARKKAEGKARLEAQAKAKAAAEEQARVEAAEKAAAATRKVAAKEARVAAAAAVASAAELEARVAADASLAAAEVADASLAEAKAARAQAATAAAQAEWLEAAAVVAAAEAARSAAEASAGAKAAAAASAAADAAESAAKEAAEEATVVAAAEAAARAEAAAAAAAAAEAAGAVEASAAAPPQPPSVPDEFCCPLTHDIMHDPVVTVDGLAYERSAIAKWLTRSQSSPLTGAPLASTLLIDNVSLRGQIRRFLELHPELGDSSC